MFKHRLSKFGRASLLAVCMLLVGGSFQSCQDWLDDYKYDDEEPKWLGASIYDFLKEGVPGHSYNCYVELIDSLELKTVLAHTGSNTLFVADDAAFERFFENNPWGVKSISDMSKAQMKVLFRSSMLDNALLLDMMASTGPNSGDEGKRLRRETSVSVVDSVPLVDGDYFEYHPGWPTYNKYWDVLRGKERAETMKLLSDGSVPMMVHFLDDYLKTNNVQVSDIQFLFKKGNSYSKSYSEGEALVFGNKIVTSGMDVTDFSDDTLTVTCKNGYVYRLDDVMLPPSNMAEELRRRADTRIISHLLDRFCVPVYDEALTKEYKDYLDATGGVKSDNDSIFRLRYFSKKFTSHSLLTASRSNPLPDELLNYDPGWNALTVNDNTSAAEDMAAMFVPKDDVLLEYFLDPQGGRFMIDYFAPDVEVTDVNTLMLALDCVPQVNIAAFVNNMMKPSFQATVASKFSKVTNDANDPIGLEEHHVEECVIANNGVIYILNNVFAPAAFEAVSAPTLVYENMRMARIMVKQLRYDYYLLAMTAKFSFLIPDDNYFVYFDPVTLRDATSSSVGDMYVFHYNNLRPQSDSTAVELWYESYKFDPRTYVAGGHKGDTLSKGTKIDISGSEYNGNAFMKNRMTDLLEYLVVVHDDDPSIPGSDRFNARKKYYSTKGYGTIKVDASDADNIKIYGGEQIETGTTVLVSSIHDEDGGVSNGISYCTVPEKKVAEGDSAGVRYYSGIPTPPTKSVYANMSAHGDSMGMYREFYDLCSFTPTRVRSALKKPGASETDFVIGDSLKVYQIFYTDAAKSMINAVPFFNTFHYTVYIPSNESLLALFEQGFPSWEDIETYSKTEPLKAASMLRLLHKFVRYHFQDNSVYLDIEPFSIPSPREGERYYEASYATSLINDRTGRFFETVVRSESENDNSTIIIKDEFASEDDYSTWAKVVNTPGEENITWNVMCRDIVSTNSNIETSSYSVIQPIDRPLLNSGLYGYDGKFRRFATNGHLVDTLAVQGGAGGNAPGFGGDNCYLVARRGALDVIVGKTSGKNPKDSLVRVDAAYLMKELTQEAANWDKDFTREELVMVDEAPVLISAEGLLLVETFNSKDKTYSYKYATKQNAEGQECRIRVNNSGEEIELVPVPGKDTAATN